MASYLIESSVCWAILYGLYALLLQREKAFEYNRAYLLAALLLGLVAPLLQVENQMASVLLAPIELSAAASPALTTWLPEAHYNPLFLMVSSLYVLGLLACTSRFLWSLYRIFLVYQASEVQRYPNYRLVIMPEQEQLPFSFGTCLFVPAALVNDSAAFDCVVKHEQAHIQQGHSLDILWVELLQVFFWFNPLLVFYKRALCDQHEYLADKAVLQHTSVIQYGQLLLDQSVSVVLPLVHPFFHSSLKKRIMMMTTPSTRMAWSKYAGSLLACALTFFLAACQKPVEQPLTPPTDDASLSYSNPDDMPYLASCEGMKEKDRRTCSNEALLQFIYAEVTYPKAAQEVGAEGIAVLDFIVNKDGSISDLQVVRSTGNADLDAEALRVLTQLQETGETWKPGIENGKVVRTSFKLPLRFRLE